MYHFTPVLRVAALLFFSLIAFSGRVAAQEPGGAPLALLTPATIEQATPSLLQPAPAQSAVDPQRAPHINAPTARRPRALVPLYVSFASLQGLDAHSTTRALDRGAEETNPLMRSLAEHPVGLLAVKAGATTVVIYAGEKMWKRNRVAAVVFMVAANSAMAWVVQHNYRAVR